MKNDFINVSYDDIRVINLKGVTNKVEFHERIREGLNVPSYYGNNLDATYDVLTSIVYRLLVVVDHYESMNEEVSEYLERFRGMCNAACEDNHNLSVAFIKSI
ncbi:Barstar (barnase inhibitor) [Eubacterium ruminantium]|nr:Barstar (barnase inhibitor) [Eubacterium ruminantium]